MVIQTLLPGYLLGTSGMAEVPLAVTVLSGNPSISSSLQCERSLLDFNLPWLGVLQFA
ncbi:MAG: hypothetical protein M1117_05455 [Candidatus Thermoplasmatota archaeon]|nr:hypothetical protein [Candidatus Thermoplasmatota archaeon]